MKQKAIFFDLYQTLINIDISNEKGGQKTGFEKVLCPFLLKNGVRESDASQLESYYSNELKLFYSEHDKEIFHHSFPFILSCVFSTYYKLTLSDKELYDLIYEYRKISRGHLALYSGVREVLEILSEHYTLVVASYTQSAYSERELEELDIRHYFNYCVYSSDLGFKKKSDKFYEKCLETVNLKATDCAMVGDNLYDDMYMANRNGIHTIWIINPLTKKEKSEIEVTPDAAIPIESIKGLPSVIARVLA